MADENPNLIPPPSIGESKASREAVPKKEKKSKLWLILVICIVLGIGLGVFVYQQSIAPVTTPTPSATVRPALSPTPAVPDISQVAPQSKNIVFPKAGEVRVYFATHNQGPTLLNWLIRLTGMSGARDLKLPASVPAGDKMAILDTGLTVAAGETVKIESFDYGDTSKASFGWIKPDAGNKCGTVNPADASALVAFATQKAQGEPLVSIQCWADWGAPGDTSNKDYNDFLVILSYVPSGTSPSPSTSASPSKSPIASMMASSSPAASKSPSPSKSPTASKSPSPAASSTTGGSTMSPTPSKSPVASKSPAASMSPSPVAQATTPTPTPRAAMPEASSLPDAGIFEVTAGTVSLGLLFIVLGALGLLML